MALTVSTDGWIHGVAWDDPRIRYWRLGGFKPMRQKVAGIVLHRTAGRQVQQSHWGNMVGAHFVIAMSGEIVQVVSLLNFGGHIKPKKRHRLTNFNSIGIEVVGAYADKRLKTYVTPTFLQINSTAWLVAGLLRHFKLQFTSQTVCTHAEIDTPGRGRFEGTKVLTAIRNHRYRSGAELRRM